MGWTTIHPRIPPKPDVPNRTALGSGLVVAVGDDDDGGGDADVASIDEMGDRYMTMVRTKKLIVW